MVGPRRPPIIGSSSTRMPARKKRIALVIGSAADSGAGYATFLRSLLPRMLAHPHAGAFAFCLVGADASPHIEVAGCDYLSIKNSVPVSRTYAWYLQLPARLRRHRFDLVHNLLGWPTFFRFATKYVVTIHDLSAIRIARQKSLAAVVVTATCIPRTLAHTDRVIVPSRFTGEDLRARFPHIDASRVIVAPLGLSEVFHRRPDPDAAAVRAAYGLASPFVLHVGTLEARKNLVTLVRAFAMVREALPTYHLVLAGQRGYQAERIFAEVERLDLGAAVTWLRDVPDAHLPGLYAAADAFAFPSLYEGFGFPPLEAMACGTPVVATNVTAVPEVVGQGALLCDPHDAGSISTALLEVLTDPTLRTRLISLGKSNVAQYTWEKTATATLGVYRELLDTKP